MNPSIPKSINPCLTRRCRDERLENPVLAIRLCSLIHPRHSRPRLRGILSLAILFAMAWLGLLPPPVGAQSAGGGDRARPKRVLLVFSEARDLPGNTLMEQAVKAAVLGNSTNRVEFFIESMDAAHFADPAHRQLFQNYIREKYQGLNLDLLMVFMARNYLLAREMSAALASNVPSVFVVINDLDLPPALGQPPFTAIQQRFDVPGTIQFIFQLQPETRRVVVVTGTSAADELVRARVAQTAHSIEGVAFEYWNNRPMNEVYQAAQTLPEGTVLLVGTVQHDITEQPFYTSQVVQTLAPLARVPVYAMGSSLIGSGAVGGSVLDFENLGASAGRLASRVLAGTPVTQFPVEVRSNGIPMVDWRAMQRWHIKPSRLPAKCVIRYQPHSLWEEHWQLFLLLGLGLLAQAITIAALLVQRQRKQSAEAEILRQRTELAHASRVSMMGQLASALTHQLNQPLGAILRNAEAAEVYLQQEPPDLNEVQAILTDIRRDDKRAGDVIDRMRSLFRRQKLTLGPLDLRDLVADTLAMVQPDAAARQVRLEAEIPPQLPAAQGDRVHVQQVLLNLIFNAMDALKTVPAARRSVAVGLVCTPAGNLQITVRDGGTGVTPEHAGHIFEPFFTTKSDGMGMGLAISKTIIEAHGGDIWMHSRGMEGTTFTFLLPPAGCDQVKPGDLPTGS